MLKPLAKPARDSKRKRGQRRRERQRVKPREMPEGGIVRRKSLRMDHEREVCATEEARGRRREEIYSRSGGKCEGCKIEIDPEAFHWHHVRGRGMGGGKRCDCTRSQCSQALCEDRLLSDGSKRKGCHTLVHEVGRLQKWFERAALD